MRGFHILQSVPRLPVDEMARTVRVYAVAERRVISLEYVKEIFAELNAHEAARVLGMAVTGM